MLSLQADQWDQNIFFNIEQKSHSCFTRKETFLTEKGNKEKTSQKVILGTTYRCQIKLMHVTLLA